MKLALLFAVVIMTLPLAAQETPVPTTAASDESEEVGEGGSADSVTLTSPFLQDDLSLLVGNVQRPNGIVWFDGHLFTVCNGDWTIYKIDDQTGDTITFVFGVRNGNSLIAEESDAGFDIWVPDPDNGALWKVDQSRESPDNIGADLEAPWGITRLDESRFLVTDTHSNSIIEVAESGESSNVHSEFRSPTGIARHENYVYVANGGSARRGIEYFEVSDDEQYSAVKPLVSGLQNTSNIVMGSDDLLYFAYALGTRGVIGRVNPIDCLEDGCSNADVETVVFSDIPAPLTITLSDDLRLFLHSRFRPEIYWVQIPS